MQKKHLVAVNKKIIMTNKNNELFNFLFTQVYKIGNNIHLQIIDSVRNCKIKQIISTDSAINTIYLQLNIIPFEDCPEIVLFENDILTLKISDKTILIRSDVFSDYGIDHIENAEYNLTYLPTSDTFSVLEQKMIATIIEHLNFYIRLQ
jgi:hypothetical protein